MFLNLTLSTLAKFSADILNFSEKTGFDQICMEYQILFSWKNFTNLSSAELAQWVVKAEIQYVLKSCLCCSISNVHTPAIADLLTLVLLNPDIPCFANSVDPDQLAEANWSGSALFAIKYANLLQQWGSSNLIGWKLEVGVAS